MGTKMTKEPIHCPYEQIAEIHHQEWISEEQQRRKHEKVVISGLKDLRPEHAVHCQGLSAVELNEYQHFFLNALSFVTKVRYVIPEDKRVQVKGERSEELPEDKKEKAKKESKVKKEEDKKEKAKKESKVKKEEDKKVETEPKVQQEETKNQKIGKEDKRKKADKKEKNNQRKERRYSINPDLLTKEKKSEGQDKKRESDVIVEQKAKGNSWHKLKTAGEGAVKLQEKQHRPTCTSLESFDAKSFLREQSYPDQGIYHSEGELSSFLQITEREELERDNPSANHNIVKPCTTIFAYVPKPYPKSRFRNLRPIGQGGFGRVFLCKDSQKKSAICAVKQMSKDRTKGRHEAAILSSLTHPNVVSYYDAFEDDHAVYISMEYLEGGTLCDAYRRYRFEEHHLAYIARQLLLGIKYLHSHKLIHRDIKSSNVMLTISGQVKLIDFGFCFQYLDDTVGPTKIVGSPYWLAPELIRMEPHGPPFDIWSLGVCILETFHQSVPFPGMPVCLMVKAASLGQAGLEQGFSKQPQRVSSGVFQEWLAQCLQRDPLKRSSADNLLKTAFVKTAASTCAMQKIFRGLFYKSILSQF